MPTTSLTRQRGGIISAVSRVGNYLEDLTDIEKTLPTFRRTIEMQLSIVNSMMEKYESVQAQIINLQESAEKKQSEEEDQQRFLDQCESLIQKLSDIVAEIPGPSADNDDDKDDSQTELNTSIPPELMNFMTAFMRQSEQQHERQMRALISSLRTASTENSPKPPVTKLPPIPLPTFNGKFASWFSFKDRFTASVINFPRISDCQKLEHLLSAVQGDAASAIKHIECTDDNFNVAWNILIDKFERKIDIVSDHIRLFYAMPKVSPSNPNAINEITNIMSETTMALDAIKVTQRDPWLIQYVLDRLDSESRILWGRECGSDVPSLAKFMAFLNQRCIDQKNSAQPAVKASAATPTSSRNSTNKSFSSRKSANALATSAATGNCRCCEQAVHRLYTCPKFLAQNANERFQTVKDLSLCRNCFSTHMTHTCTFRKCLKCQGKHNVLLHDKFALPSGDRTPSSTSATPSATPSPTPTPAAPTPVSPAVLAVNSLSEMPHPESPPRIFLATAIVDILTSSGNSIPCRVILDGAAQVNIMTKDLYERINLPQFPSNITIAGVNDRRNRTRFYVNATISSRCSDVSFTFKCFVLPKISGDIPNWNVDTSALNVPSHLQLADPSWARSGPVDLLLCGNPYWASWLNSTIELGHGLPMLKETVFGYVVVGEHEPIPPPDLDFLSLNTTALNETLRRFWEIEDIPRDVSITEDQMAAEHHFVSTHTRDHEGRFVVRLPFKDDPKLLGDSRPLAVRQLLSLERKFGKNSQLRSLYCEVMNDQLKNQWIEPVPDSLPSAPAFYMPHHGVLKDSTTTKLRIVFNASAKTTSGYSLNDLLRIGPTVQPTLCVILLKFRKHPYAMTADISKMYLQVRLDPSDSNFQRFLWRFDNSQPIQEFRVNRVCFGVASSPFLATRALCQLAQDYKRSHSLASQTLSSSFYVDDCILSSETLQDALKTREQLVQVLASAGFPLTKWSGNHPDLRHSPGDFPASSTVQFGDTMTSALGLKWNSELDCFCFTCPISPLEPCITKRHLASGSAKIFDPIGLIGPVVIEAKLIMQEAHELEKNWDSPLPPELLLKWQGYVKQLQDITQLSIPRWISDIPSPTRREIHVFSDASQRAYGATVYVVTYDAQDNVCSRLLTSKSRVAPVQKLTIPQLELCGALLAAELGRKVYQAYIPDELYCWCDSMVVLHWIHNNPDNYKIFIARRLKKIRAHTEPSEWRHVSTHDNPADIISRGSTPLQLKESILWWNGPSWLLQPKETWPSEFLPASSPDSSVESTALTSTISSDPNPTILSGWLSRFSSLHKIQRIVIYYLRFLGRSTPDHRRVSGKCSTEEYEVALKKLISWDQSENLPGLKQFLERFGNTKHAKWKQLTALAPFVDSEGLIRVGGRLQHSNEPFAVKHPILLPKSALTDLIIQREHLKELHAGPTGLLASLRQRYWPLGGRNSTKKICHRCVRCSRAQPSPITQLMGSLPGARVTLNRPFQCTGVDYAGPIMYRPTALRGAAQRRIGLLKGYIAVFVCMASKAVHLEFVTSLSTESFIAAFRRFAARRTAPRHMFSDCGKNFEGATRELGQLMQQERTQSTISGDTRDEGVIWHFNPPRAPHHGGLWEACVKSVKYHLARVVQHTTLSYEEMCTILCQIEATLNSRPIGLVSNDPNEPSYLTPGHFLTGGPTNALPDPDVSEIPQNRLNMWQFCQQRSQEFAKKFRLFYLNTLQQRSKWKVEQPNLTLGEVVLFMDEAQHGPKWSLGRVSHVHPGRDGRVRVIRLRTPRGVYTRPISKVARLSERELELPCSDQSEDPSEQSGEDVEASVDAVGTNQI